MKAYSISIAESNFCYSVDAENIESAKKKLERELKKKVTILDYKVVGYY